MYKLLNNIFGWDYIQWKNFCDSGVSRVYSDYLGRVFYWRYKLIHVADIIKSPEDVLWLTCVPDKYFKARMIEEQKGDTE